MAGSSSVESRGVATSQINFLCQRCSQPLQLDQSFSSLDSRTYDDLTAPLLSGSGSASPLSQETSNQGVFEVYKDSAISHKEVLAPNSSTQDSSQGFMMVGETATSKMDSFVHRIKVAAQLFDIMSGNTDIDHPLCEECTTLLLNQLDQQYRIVEEDCKLYRQALDHLNEEAVNDKEETELHQELEKLRLQESDLIKQLEALEEERKEIAEETNTYKSDLKQLELEEKSYWKNYTAQKQQLLNFQEEQRSVDNQLRYAQTQLDRLRKTNVFNATFHIWHNGHFGTINGFRLGRLPSVPVEWNEINAAWGQTVLLLHSLAHKMNFKFQRYRLVPLGNHSFIECLNEKSKQLPLYGTGGFRFFWDTKVDQAMVAFLDCLQQFEEEIERGDSSFRLPYKIANGKIEDPNTNKSYSIKIQFNSEEQWTKALKFMLTNLKWALAWVASQFTN
ncbi:putative beclin-1 [Apostichopus japonicus]|uniref:Putative beclin-1 n=2 Tax=Stichopus japonicus TaxID=307972 RepID=A0A2G8LQ60_STIJA|nr:putative beclin-1 [Apostichopus japonicus]